MDYTKDHYKTLGITAEASADEIKAAYRATSLTNNRSKKPHDKIDILQREINEAGEILKNSAKKSDYDLNRVIDDRSDWEKQRDYITSKETWVGLGNILKDSLGQMSIRVQGWIQPFTMLPSTRKTINLTLDTIEQGNTFKFSAEQRLTLTKEIAGNKDIPREELIKIVELLPRYTKAKAAQHDGLRFFEDTSCINLNKIFTAHETSESFLNLIAAIEETSEALRNVYGLVEAHKKQLPNSMFSIEGFIKGCLDEMDGNELRTIVETGSNNAQNIMNSQVKLAKEEAEQQNLKDDKKNNPREEAPEFEDDLVGQHDEPRSKIMGWIKNAPFVGRFFGGQ